MHDEAELGSRRFISSMTKIRRAKAERNCCNQSLGPNVEHAMSLSLSSMVHVFHRREDAITRKSIDTVTCAIVISER